MVALLESYASKNETPAKNCVGDFFVSRGDFVGEKSLQVLDRVGETSLIYETLRWSPPLSQNGESGEGSGSLSSLLSLITKPSFSSMHYMRPSFRPKGSVSKPIYLASLGGGGALINTERWATKTRWEKAGKAVRETDWELHQVKSFLNYFSGGLKLGKSKDARDFKNVFEAFSISYSAIFSQKMVKYEYGYQIDYYDDFSMETSRYKIPKDTGTNYYREEGRLFWYDLPRDSLNNIYVPSTISTGYKNPKL